MSDLKTALQQPVFIVSTGRCGSTMLSRLLALHPSLFVFNQYPSLRTEAFVNWRYPGRREGIKKRIRKKRDELVAAVRRNRFIYVENSTSAAFLMKELHELFDAKFIFLFRDGRDFVRSGMSRDWYKPDSMMNRFKTLLRRRFLIATGRDTADTLLIPPPEYKTRFEKIAWRWVAVNRIILDHCVSLPEGRVLSLKVEDLGREKLIELHSFLGIDVDETLIAEMLDVAGTKPNKSQNYAFPPYTDWSVSDRERFGVIAGDMLRTLGYQL